jgi:glycosyltransferase involved in cell wall biosynthesis
MNTPLVSVIMITYQQGCFLTKAIDSILMQECDFIIELIIADDASKDNTQEIVESFKNHHNYNWIKYTRHEENKGMINNLFWALNQSKGIYCAFCEGDDYWIDPFKLKKQLYILESNRHISGVCSAYLNVNKDGKFLSFSKKMPFDLELVETKHLIQKNLIATCTVLMRNNFFKLQNSQFYFNSQQLGDLPLWLLSSLNGPIKFLDFTSAAYRNNVGVSSTLRGLIHATISIKIREDFLSFFISNYNIRLSYLSNKFFYLNQSAQIFAQNKRKFKALLFLFKSFYYYPLSFFNKNRLQSNSIIHYLTTLKYITN